MRILYFFVSHSIFIAFCAVALCLQTNLVLDSPINLQVYSFVFLSTICSYNFYWLVSKFFFTQKISTQKFLKNNASFVWLFALTLFATIYFIALLPSLWMFIFISFILTAAYSLPLLPFKLTRPLQKLGFFKTIILAFTWAFITVLLPGLANGYFNLNLIIIFVARFLFMLLLCIIFDRRDINVDKMHGLHSLATDTSAERLNIITTLVFIGYFILGLVLRFHLNDKPQMFAFLITGALVWLVHQLSLKKRGYYFYYFLVDGLMLFSGAASFIATFF